ncbi:transcriptional regulator [Bacillus sp. SA1-12]|uniref:MurR/RpiR family transcriptional regulator n=1 Tax=Bacillus sp. SA1-12 TaxID=1455638 RepID=UPI000626D488|nr:MurR/RpiR family transcriptional regulator [Bacillus sp. SA1-12]KKI92100.1 transcriptional regulator [Bacillus sp. SA1-12]
MKAVKSSPIVLISSIYKSLTKAEQKVADFVLTDPHEAVYSSVTDLAEKSGVGETSVIRFCRKLGFKGFQEFKLTVAQNLVSPEELVHGKLDEKDSADIMARKITTQNIQILEDTFNLVQKDKLEMAANVILKAKKIYMYGVGSSGITAMDLKNRFMRLGLNVEAVSDSHFMAMSASLVSKDDVVIGISTSGSTKDIVEAIKIAKANNAHIICLTNYALSPITTHANITLLAAAREAPLQGGSFSAKIAQLQILEILITLIGLKQKKKSIESIEKTAKAVLNKMY